jgi:hypothetical protein
MDKVVEDLRTLVKEGEESPTKEWGYRVCKAGRKAHIHAWSVRISKDDATSLKEILSQLADMMSGVETCQQYERNTRVRISSLESYISGGMPTIPDDALDDERAMLARTELEERLGIFPSACAKLLRQRKAAVA